MTRTRRLLVTRRDAATAAYEAVGELLHDPQTETYTFTYRDDVSRALPGLPLDRPHVSTQLFPLFGHRVVSPHRSDHDDLLGFLALDPMATPFEVLSRSGGRSPIDTLELTPMPDPGRFDIRFLVHGIRHLLEQERDWIDELRAGQPLLLEPEPTNEVDPAAILVTDAGRRLGYVPRPLLDYVHPALEHSYELTVDRVNPREAGYHMRLLVRLAGTLPESSQAVKLTA